MKEESEKVGLKLNIQNTKIMASDPITSWQIHGETVVPWVQQTVWSVWTARQSVLWTGWRTVHHLTRWVVLIKRQRIWVCSESGIKSSQGSRGQVPVWGASPTQEGVLFQVGLNLTSSVAVFRPLGLTVLIGVTVDSFSSRITLLIAFIFLTRIWLLCIHLSPYDCHVKCPFI